MQSKFIMLLGFILLMPSLSFADIQINTQCVATGQPLRNQSVMVVISDGAKTVATLHPTTNGSGVFSIPDQYKNKKILASITQGNRVAIECNSFDEKTIENGIVLRFSGGDCQDTKACK